VFCYRHFIGPYKCPVGRDSHYNLLQFRKKAFIHSHLQWSQTGEGVAGLRAARGYGHSALRMLTLWRPLETMEPDTFSLKPESLNAVWGVCKVRAPLTQWSGKRSRVGFENMSCDFTASSSQFASFFWLWQKCKKFSQSRLKKRLRNGERWTLISVSKDILKTLLALCGSLPNLKKTEF